jgi:hypothetical protein
MRQLWLNPSPKSRRLLPVLIGTACAAALAAAWGGSAAWGTACAAALAAAWGSATSADVAPEWP